MQRILRTIELICLVSPLDQTESAMADLTGTRKINFVCMKLYMQFVYKLAIQPIIFYKKINCSTICIFQEYVVG